MIQNKHKLSKYILLSSSLGNETFEEERIHQRITHLIHKKTVSPTLYSFKLYKLHHFAFQ